MKAAVLIGAGKTFIAGADINMFVQMTSGKGTHQSSSISVEN